ncbi:MAG: hypothetical protein ACR2RV_29870 [Verrucomicrobiales bacterium]
MMTPIRTAIPLLLVAIQFASAAPFKITVVDQESGWPVPLVELTTIHNTRFITDNAGVVAIDLPELMDRASWFTIRSDGYEVPADGFGYRGVRLTPTSAGSARVEVKRTMLAKRLGRLTGAGIFGESQKLGQHLDWRESGCFGSDTVQIAAHRGKLFWAWGDTNLARYPLGVFDTTSATSALAPLERFEPPVKLALDYFSDEAGLPRGVADMDGDGPTWIGGYVSLPDKDGEARLVASYAKIRGFLQAYRTGLCVWDEASESFRSTRVLWEKSDQSPKPPPAPNGHPAFWSDENGKNWLLFGDPFPNIRMPASFEAWQDPEQWENLEPQASVPSAGDGSPIKPHRGSIAWNAFRDCWVAIFTQIDGKPSRLGEIWYAEADQPTGPWRNAVKVLSHTSYTFYNPHLHAEISPEGSPILLFEGTYTNSFSDNPTRTARYDYNQILYRLDLDDPRMLGQQP